MRRALLLLLLPLLLMTGCPFPDFQNEAEPPGPDEQKVVLPIFRIPRIDFDGANQIMAVFIDTEDPEEVWLEVVFADEDHPIPLFDLLYDCYRWAVGYHRVADTQGLYYTYEDFHGQPDPIPLAIGYGGSYSGDQTWDVYIAEHFGAHIPWEEYEKVEGRPVIYVNTWNHLYSNVNNNPELDIIEVDLYPVYRGSGSDVQDFFEATWEEWRASH